MAPDVDHHKAVSCDEDIAFTFFLFLIFRLSPKLFESFAPAVNNFAIRLPSVVRVCVCVCSAQLENMS